MIQDRSWTCRNVVSAALLVATGLASACGGGGGGGSPTVAIPQPPIIAGSWSGTLRLTGVPATLIQMQINQNGETISNSSVTNLGVTIPISGTVNAAGHFVWQNVPVSGGCGTLKGDMQVAAGANSMTGTVELNSLSCSTGSFFSGTASLSKNASTAVPDEPGGLEGLAIEKALRELAGAG